MAADGPALLTGGEARADFRAGWREGVRDALPVLVAITPFGLVTGVAAIEAGLAWAPAVAMSYLVFAGTAQLAALQLIAVGSPAAVVLATAVMLNLRFALYSATLAPHVRAAPWPLRTWIAGTITDQSMALGTQRFGRFPERGGRVGYLTGVSTLVWLVWTSAATVGVFAGAALPAGWSWEFAVPLVFLTLWVGALKRGTPPIWAAGATAALVAVAARGLPLNLGLMLAAFAGIGAGLAWERWRSPAPRPGGRA